MDKIVKKVLTFSKKLKGIKYTWWTGNEKEEDDFFCVNKIPSMEELKKMVFVVQVLSLSIF